ncbi:MAG: hypothetical protein HQK81_03610 [Desulfovibrionaceae bacterium]|nr:hypothetical protein [Desulfovibrionaceae bacterium]MBF0513129.1 hypothetical protein [Desulfovibrionaceae bacterium]
MIDAVLPVTGRYSARQFYREARRLEFAARLRLESLETVLASDPEAAWLLVTSVALQAADLALFLERRPLPDDLETARENLQRRNTSKLGEAALRLVSLAGRKGEADPAASAGEAVLAARLFLKQARRAIPALLREKPFRTIDRWLVPLEDNTALAAFILALAAGVAVSFWPVIFPQTNFEKRLDDFRGIKRLLERYRHDNGGYPVTNEFIGLYANGHTASPAWIPGLVPSYTRALPRDPRQDDDPAHQYLYNSDGKDYKLIAHNVEDCEAVKKTRPQLIDPVRDCRAYGIWSSGARGW